MHINTCCCFKRSCQSIRKRNADPLSSVPSEGVCGTRAHINTLGRKHTHTHLDKDKPIPSLKNKFLGNNRNNFNVFTDGTLLPPSHRTWASALSSALACFQCPLALRWHFVPTCGLNLRCLRASDTFLFHYIFDVMSDSYEFPSSSPLVAAAWLHSRMTGRCGQQHATALPAG